MIVSTIIELITVSLKFIDRERADRIKIKILNLKEAYRDEISKEYDSIDHAAIDSIRAELRDIVQLYCAAAQGQDSLDK